jgi:DNA repair protein RecN (Recombination protein N)
MLIGLNIRNVVLIESLDLGIGPGLTALTGETGAGKSIILDALGLATGARADAGLVRRGAAQASVTAMFDLAASHNVWSMLDDKGLGYAPGEELILRRLLGADGRSRAFVNDQATSVGVLKELGNLLLEVHGQHETVGLLDARNHRPLLDQFGDCGTVLNACGRTWETWRMARQRLEALRDQTQKAAQDLDMLTLRLEELDRLAPKAGEETQLAAQRALLGASEKALSEIAAAREAFSGESLTQKLAQAFRAVERARERAVQAGASPDSPAVTRLTTAGAAIDRALVEAQEAAAAIDLAAEAFDFEPDQLDKAEERLFALRAMARKLNVPVEGLPAARIEIAQTLAAVESADEALKAAAAEADKARAQYLAAASDLTTRRQQAGHALALAVEGELAPLKLDKARFRVAIEPLAAERAGPAGMDRIEFEVMTNPGAPFGGLGVIASGGELSRFALALKAALAGRADQAQPLMIFDEVDQGVGGAVADAVGLRLRKLAANTQVLVVTHSPQVAARANAHWRVAKAGDGDRVSTRLDILPEPEREEELARMLSGANVTEAARAAARALMG